MSDPNEHQNNQVVIHRTDGAIPTDDYIIEMEIVALDGDTWEPGDYGVYFAGEDVGAAGSTTEELACDASTVSTGDLTYYDDNTAVVTSFGADGCDVPADNRAVSLITDASDLGLGLNDDYMTLNIPSLVYDADEVDPDTEIRVRVKLTRAPCGAIITADHCVGTMVSACSMIPEANTIIYPYFTPADGDGFWDGLAITNYTNATGEVLLTMYEEDGDVATATVTITGQSMYVNTLSNMVADGTFTLTSSVEGTLGNSRSWIVGSSDAIAIDGFSMIANGATGESMGYLPRMVGQDQHED